MKRVRLIPMLLLFSISYVWGQAFVVPEGFQVIDMRDGLAESRIRQIMQMPDGRMAIATTVTIDICDGTRFTSYRLQPEKADYLPGYHGNRQLTCDVAGRVWLRNEQTLYVADTRLGEVVTRVDSLLRALDLKEQDVVTWSKKDTPHQDEGIKDVTAVEHDCYGGLWIGTKENGILYSNPKRTRQFQTEEQPFNYPRKPNHATERARRLEEAYAPQATNCMLDDSLDGYAYLGTIHGLMVFDAKDRLLATLNEQDGLHTANIQALIHDNRGDVWASTSVGITRIHCAGRDSFCITNFGRLDGIRVGGREFRPCQIYKDSLGVITVGFVGGIVTFHPDSVNVPRYTFHFPRAESRPEKTVPAKRPYWYLLLTGFLLLTAYILWRRTHRYRKNNRQNRHMPNPKLESLPRTSEETLERLKQKDNEQTADEQFLHRLQELVEANISNEDFSVQILSELMAMERSGLYRRVQTLTGLSPSTYIKRVRMDVAARLLRETSLSFADIAFRTGFSTTKYFNKVFKESFSTTPSEYRESHH